MANLRTTQPTNRNFLSPTGFQMVLAKTPDTNFFVTKHTVPNLNLAAAETGSPFVAIPLHGDHLNYEPLVVQFHLNESLSNYIELYTWIRQLGFSESHEELERLRALDRGKREYTEISIFQLSSKRNPIIEFQYHDAFPVGLTGWDMDHTRTSIDPIVITAVFRYTTFSIVRANEYVPVDNQSPWG
jgi:hypothetical protein